MTLLILVIVISLVAWALRLMERAIASQEFSLMLAGFLVASSAAAMMAVYFLMGNYFIFIDQVNPSLANSQYGAAVAWDETAGWEDVSWDSAASVPDWVMETDAKLPGAHRNGEPRS
jgi:hypothetical protein